MSGREEGSGGDVRQIAAGVQHQRQRISHDGRAGAGLDRFGRQMPAEGARARHRRNRPSTWRVMANAAARPWRSSRSI